MEQLPNPIKVLLIDDDEDDYLIIRALVNKIKKSPFILEWCGSATEGRQAIAADKHDVYLIDYRLGELNGLELLQEFNLTKTDKPFIILTGAGDEQVEQRAMRMGAADYLVKGKFDPELLARVLRYCIQRKHIEQQRVAHLIEVNRTKDEFIALASHELRTPATAVKQYIGMVLEGYFGDITLDQAKSLRQAYESNERQITIINNLLRIAKLDLETIRLNKVQTDVTALVQGVVQDLDNRFQQRRQRVSCQQPASPVMASIDPDHFRMAVSNVIENASKYSPDDKDITIRLHKINDGTIKLAVKDQGVGIDKKDFHELFKKFSRLHNPLSVSAGGSGLGLYWTKQVVELHGGRVEVVSELGKGSQFTLRLPAGP